VSLPLAHVAGIPAEETLPAPVPALAAFGALAVGRIRAACGRLRRSPPDPGR
jgi:hypothetical protein